MNVRKMAALIGAMAILIAVSVGLDTPANAQGRHHGGGHGYHHGGHVMGHRVAYARPGYAHYSWAWYQRHSAAWRAAHPYHGSPTLGVYIHL